MQWSRGVSYPRQIMLLYVNKQHLLRGSKRPSADAEHLFKRSENPNQ
jgi:hypothetical protein